VQVVTWRPRPDQLSQSTSREACELGIHVFGAATPSGEAFRQQAAASVPSWSLASYSRQPNAATAGNHPADFNDAAAFRPAGKPGHPALWISFAPIWLLAPFLEQLARHHPERLRGLRGLIACSSSSAFTKRFSANRFDRELVAKLTGSEDQLIATCRRLQVSCHILQPALIYGQVGAYGDRNLSRLTTLLRLLPLLPLPKETGLRQPIHASQLAAVVLNLAVQHAGVGWNPDQPEQPLLPWRIALGGDDTLSYTAMLQALQDALPPGDPARRCRLLPIPNRLFFWLSSPVLLNSPKAFEAVLRMGADLNGFIPTHEILGEPARPFPVLPLA